MTDSLVYFYYFISYNHILPKTEGDVRLVNGNDVNQGRVEIFQNNTWGSVCDTDWDSNDAQVTCRQLGLPHAGAMAVTGGRFGEGTGPIWLSELQCNGTEDALVDCAKSTDWQSNDCEHVHDAGVVCSGKLTLIFPEKIHF